MDRTETDKTTGTSASANSRFPSSVLRSRWLLIIAVTAVIAFGGQSAPGMVQYALVGAMVVSNLVLALLRSRGVQLTQALELVTVVDVLIVTLVVGWFDPSPETYVAVFAALILAMALGRVGVIMVLMLLVCGVYAGYLYTEIGPYFWRHVPLVLRVPFIFAVGLHFAAIAAYVRREKAHGDALVTKARRHAGRADHLAKEQGRLRALSQIGRLALTSADAAPVGVLLEMAHRAQRVLGASRSALVVFPRSIQEESWNGRTKDRSTDVRPLTVDRRALRAVLPDGKVSELHPGDDKDLMKKVKVFFPDSNPFGSLLVAAIETDDGVHGALFLIDDNHQRTFNDGERDFLWTVSLMTGAFIQARQKLEDEVQLRTLITNAPVIMFALSRSGTITLFEGRGSAILAGAPANRVGKSLFDLADNREETKEAFEAALAGRLTTGSLLLEGTLFETQYSPLHGVDGDITGVMGVTTAVHDTRAPRASAPAAAAPATAPAETPAAPPAAPEEAPSGPPPAFPNKRPDLKPLIPLADEDDG